MNGEDTLFSIVDLAIALIGFSSIVTALRRSKEKSWSSQEINGLVFLALMAIGAIVFSLLPLSFYYMGLMEYQIYSISAVIYCVFSISVILGLYIRGKQTGFPSRRPRVFNLFAILSIGVIVMMGLVAMGKISNGVFGYYLFGVIWLLILAFVQFMVFLSLVGFIQDVVHSEPSLDSSAKPLGGGDQMM
jgi:hypothetical protein